MMPASSTLCSKIFRVKAKAHSPTHPRPPKVSTTPQMSALSAPCRSLNTPVGLSFLAFSHPSLLPFNLGSKASQSLGVYTNCKSFSLTRSSSFTFASTFHHRIQLISSLFLGFTVSLLTRIQAQCQQDFLSICPFTSPQCCQLYLAHGRKGQYIVFVE